MHSCFVFLYVRLAEDIIDNKKIRPYHVTRTPTKGSAVSFSRDTDGDNIARIIVILKSPIVL